ncbi:hypothetical protein TTHERM_00041580 (macronuclear) [Tetrahymena thermophila SB210]|uniref:Uncharacterized protein n=1 Tax=Tetrahymena thermophila (strain SB210) TaxID=312017 RepID=Q22LV9_TETTS|nr:hypothetical protein TTHERM_00041580 [Tetrahymena thermophila SB210]EAR86673.1 hypothetical protein TTHERM_00041580 [Tetrahymena thermophila SB210]|eukprot:XP_977261.1 hypothetical protein TTHERM_00041580 [Tetrahymena thermophila SB210]
MSNMFQKKQKVPQYLGNSFKDFNDDYQNLTKNLSSKFKHTSMEQIEGSNDQKPNQNKKQSGNTWDSQHLDSFVANSPWATQSVYYQNNGAQSQLGNRLQAYSPNNASLYQNDPKKRMSQSQNQTRVYSSLKNNSTMANKNKDSNTNVRESFFFTSVSRFVDDNNYKMIDYPDRYSNKNFLVSDRRDVDINYYNKHFSVSKHTDNNSMKLSMCNQPVTLMTPAQKLDQLLNLKSEQKDFQNWKSEYAKMNKKYRVHKGMYPSGILQVDNPNNFESQLYSDEAKKEYLQQVRKEQFKDLHKDRLANLQRTNPQIEFLNNYSQRVFPNKDYDDKVKAPQLNASQYKFQHQYDSLAEVKNSSQIFNNTQRERLTPNWNSKRPVTTNLGSQGIDTGDRLFGAEAQNYSLVRAKYLREQDTKNRNFNIISYADNKIEFKKDKGLQNIEQTNV